MNHIQSQFKTEEGVSIPYHSWEIRQGGYKWVALVLQGPFLAANKNKRFIDFLLEKYFKVYAPDIPEMTVASGRTANYGGLREYAVNIESFRAFVEKKEGSLPIIPFVFSLSALPFLYYYFNVRPPVRAFALFSPIFDCTGTLFGSSFLFKKRLNLKYHSSSILSDTVSERSEIEKEIERNGSVSKKLVKELKKLSVNYPGKLEMAHTDVNVGIFFGEADSLISLSSINALKDNLKAGRVSLYSYPRVKHILFYDKYWKRTEDDLSLFLSGLAF
ncbi:MAG: hypothetical protein DRP57_11795 [Spirochaetes bacterium]|nr:MAG: hypothetical protein DRP57_11795 [Spirochaetota bacterium]